MRTVSFLGCTLPVSFFGGIAPVGAPVGGTGDGLVGGISAIALSEDKRRPAAVKFNSKDGQKNRTSHEAGPVTRNGSN
jgi:hypothetical protein